MDHGAGMTYTAAKLADCNVSFLDMKSLNNDSELEESLKGYDLISFGLKSSYYSLGMKVIKFAKAQGSKVMVGGYHATAAPNELLENSDIDYIFHGESELTFPKFLKDPELFSREIFGEKPQNLDDLPIMDRSMYREPLENCLNWWHGGVYSKMTTVMAARGCPYKCAFCQPLENNHFGKKLRRRSVDSLIFELRQLKDLYNPECLMIHDDTFLIQPKWIEEFIEKYPEIGLPFWASARSDGICEHSDLVKRLVKVGWELVSVGFESGSQRILDKLKKGTTVEQNLESAKIIKSTGAKIYANYITAIPWETKWDIQATAKMADTIAAEMPSWAYFTPYPGCELGEELINRGWSLLNRETYDRCPSGIKVKHVDYDYVTKVRKGFREEVHQEFCDIIIPTYNNEKFTIDCLNSIKEHTAVGSYRVIWIDNNSEQASRAKVKEVIADIENISIKLKTNEGFVGAINAGLEVSNAPNVCLLNNDTVVSAEWLRKLTFALHASSDMGIVGAMTDYGKGVGMDSHHSLSLHSSLLPPNAKTWSLDKINKELETGFSGRTYSVQFVAFLCAVIKREVIDKVGHLDPNYAMGMWDDLDYNRLVQYAGYRTELCLDTCIKHYGRSTFTLLELKENLNIGKLLQTNRQYLDRKWRKINASRELKVDLGMNRVFIISRAIYNTMGTQKGIGILSEDRLAIMQRYFVNSLKNQTDQDFILYLIVGGYENETTKRIEALDWGNITVQYIYTDGNLDEWKNAVRQSRNWGQEKDIGCPEDIVRKCGHPQANIMARLDTDDWVAPGWIAHMKYLAKTTPVSHFLINYQIIGQWTDGRLYNFNAAHTKARTSPFIVLVQKTDPRISPYEDLHLRMGSKFSLVHTIPPGYAFMVVHGENRSNRFYKNDTYIGGTDLVGSGPKVIPIKSIEKSQVYIDNTISGTDWRARIARVKVR
uniref:Putative glycosyltransferase n=1 Tax=viral metagenome TaxID=1070528 RepID=A0A6M3XCW6_9ZZZZ